MKIVESHYFNGSSSFSGALDKWFNGGTYHKPGICTQDYTTTNLPDGTIVNPGDSVGLTEEGKFVRIPRSDKTGEM